MSNDIPGRAAVGMAVRAFREAARLSLTELADACQIHISLLSRTENGLRDLMLHETLEVCRLTHTDIGRFTRVCMALHKDGSAESILATKQALKDISQYAAAKAAEGRPPTIRGETPSLTFRDIPVIVNPAMKPGTVAMVQGGKVVSALKNVGCPCEPMGWMARSAPAQTASYSANRKTMPKRATKAQLFTLLTEAERLLYLAEGAAYKERLKDKGGDCTLPHETRMFARAFSKEDTNQTTHDAFKTGDGSYDKWRDTVRDAFDAERAAKKPKKEKK